MVRLVHCCTAGGMAVALAGVLVRWEEGLGLRFFGGAEWQEDASVLDGSLRYGEVSDDAWWYIF